MVNQQVMMPVTVYVEYETTNQSFIDMHHYLKQVGIKNNTFMLLLYDSGLAGVDPYDPGLSLQMKQRILRECIINFWYFEREVVRIPVQGATGSGIRFQLHRGNLAMNFLFTLNYNMFVELPRQKGKTVAALCRYLWVYNFGTTNSKIMFIHKDHAGSKDNLKHLKEIRDALPEYLQMSSATTTDGKKLKVPNTVVSIQNPFNKNQIVTFPSARSKDAADKLGRGATMPLQYYDEMAFLVYNQIIYAAATPAYETAAQNAKRNNAPYGILMTTTPGDLTTDEGVAAYNIRNNATPWNERYYDLTYDQLEELRKSNTNSPFFLVSYTYQQLGEGEEYFKNMVVDLLREWPKIRREVMLEWAQISSTCPFKQDDLDKIKDFCHDPIRTLFFGRAQQYQFLIYEDIDLRYPPIIGVDVSGSLYQDSSAITIIDSKTTKVCAALNCNYIPADDLADIIYTLCTKFMPNAVVNIERNGGFGVSVLQRLCKTSIKKNLYYEIKEKPIEESFNGVRTNVRKARVKVYGSDSNKETRARLIELLYNRVAYHKDKFICPILHHEMECMEVKKNGRVEHSDTSHDDQVFSYLWALYVFYEGKNLAENFGIQKNTIKTDEDVEIEDSSIDKDEALEKIDIDTTDDSDINYKEKEKINKFFAKDSKIKLNRQFQENLFNSEQDQLNIMLAGDRVAKDAYERKYRDILATNDPKAKKEYEERRDNILRNGVETGASITYTNLPDSIFGNVTPDDDFDSIVEKNKQLHGNLYSKFMSL